MKNGILKVFVKKFIKNYEDVGNAQVRAQCGKLSSIVGIIVNLILFGTKFAVGTLFHSVSITGDAVNNLSDAGSSVISLVSFKMSGKPADHGHPFGHARIEYVATSIVAVLILSIGIELLKASWGKVLHPGAIEFSILSVIVLVFSIAVKLVLYRFNTGLGRHINSSVMRATAADSLSDVMATTTVLASTLISPLIGFQLDGYMGIAVSVFIMVSGIKILKETLDSLLGQGPSEELAYLIGGHIRKYEGVMGIHDLVVHDYGPQRSFASVHVEVDAKVDILTSHELIDRIEREVITDHGIHLVIHLDPVIRDDPAVNMLCRMAEQVLSSIDETLSLHDFRVVPGPTRKKLIFDITVPYTCKIGNPELLEAIQDGLKKKDRNLEIAITIDRPFV